MVILEDFSNWQGILHHKFISEGAMVNKERYKMCSSIYGEQFTWCPKLWVFPRQYPGTSDAVCAAETHQAWPCGTSPHPPYFPGLALKVQSCNKGSSSFKYYVTGSQCGGFHKCFEQQHTHKFVVAEGQYFEGDCI